MINNDIFFHPTKISRDIGKKVCSFLAPNEVRHLGLTDKCFHKCIKGIMKSAELEAPKLYHPRPIVFPIPGNWFDDVQMLLFFTPKFSTKEFNRHPLGITLTDPAPYLKELGFDMPLYYVNGQKEMPGSNFQKVMGWIIFIRMLLKRKEDTKKIDIIENIHLGEILNHCAKIFLAVPLENEFWLTLAATVNASTTKVIAFIAKDFLQSNSNKIKAPVLRDSEENIHHQLHKNVLLEHINHPRFVNTIGTAWNPDQNTLMISTSGDLISSSYKSVNDRRNALGDQCKTMRHPQFKNPISVKMVNDLGTRITYKILAKIKRIIYKRTYNNRLEKEIVDLFVARLYKKYTRKDDLNQKLKDIEVIYHHFYEALSNDTWMELFDKIQTVEMTTIQFAQIIQKEHKTPKQLNTLGIANLRCSEVKIVLDLLRQAGKQAQMMPPQTIKQQWSFSASLPLNWSKPIKEQKYIISREMLNGRKVIHYDLCNMCKYYWPIFERFYWSVCKSGLDLELFEALDRRVHGLYSNMLLEGAAH